jgi:glutamate 5-kinase
MKTKFYSLALLFISLVVTSCSKDDANATTPIAPANGFTWTENGGTTVKTASIASFTTQYKTIFAKNDPVQTLFEINLSAATPATYTIDGSTVALAYVVNSQVFMASSGSVIITANANGKMTGTFQATGTTTGGVSSVKGSFTNIDVVQ